MIFFNLLNLFWHTDKNFCFYTEVNFWDFVRNDNSNKGTTAWLNETRFGPKKKSSTIYLGPKNLDTFWCTGWAWNCQIIFRCASIHGRAGFILETKTKRQKKNFCVLWPKTLSGFIICERQRALYGIKCVLRIFWQTWLYILTNFLRSYCPFWLIIFHHKVCTRNSCYILNRKFSRFYMPICLPY